ncbi:hypothetical protein AVEN_79547-1 [Araneus ventricosus]|uniref:Uncharacterized protein n=1 Tax=Araneus ventricosus TaxID=182803 RepID=A0A4Y2KPL7_ARAVE|nr:hypothetical protein AVEN_79547-1 [Araneus ventricosus]
MVVINLLGLEYLTKSMHQTFWIKGKPGVFYRSTIPWNNYAAPKANHSLLFSNGIFGTREGKTYRQGQQSIYLSNLVQMIRNGEIQKNLKSKTQSANSNLRPRCEGSG